MNSNEAYSAYLPVDPDYLEIITGQITIEKTGKIFFFNPQGQVDEVEGKVVQIVERLGEGVFAVLDNGAQVRVDRIITLFGKVGAAYDEYDAYANACMDCTGGQDPDDR